ncbi:MAG: hypothetical protein EOO68_23275 [Moraxellaceae bacterium]|nr:MAG: hypothetical protein EOO68_23275 [Moraxellaceae bacterium]
MMTKIGSLRA